MIAIDTNIVVRFLTKDDAVQHEQAAALFQKAELFIPESVLLETEWVLRFAYGFSAVEVVGGIRNLLGLENVYIDDPKKLAKALDWHEQGIDFADALHLADCDTLSELVTFDQKFIRRAQGKSHCRVRKP